MWKAVTLVALCCVAVYAAPQKRFFIPGFEGSVFDTEILKCDVQLLLDTLGSAPTEAACEGECQHLITGGSIFSYGCPLICHSFEHLVATLHETPAPGETRVCGGKATTPAA
ncbi:uncharacterized protein LOC128236550 [Mya arenaria]|uniref:uncharacterized protein LOC128236550 n=1 Tax=Mya arenaria TaxID=6604 RepID=UPI0022E7C41C|nr:uncharacterized protein LOC128236550 [Mya arenaria]